jgi:hypothetical protein
MDWSEMRNRILIFISKAWLTVVDDAAKTNYWVQTIAIIIAGLWGF